MAKFKQGKNAPRRPLSSFALFVRQRKLTCPEIASKSIAELNRLLASEWSTMSADDKQVFQDEANKERVDYKRAYEEYKQTNEYKNWLELKNKQKGLVKSKGNLKDCRKKRANQVQQDDAYEDKCRVSIFTVEFLEYNRIRELTLRQLKKQVINKCFYNNI